MSNSQSDSLVRKCKTGQSASPPLWPELQERCQLPELMDDPSLDDDLHYGALNGLRRINILSRSDAILWPTLRTLSRELNRPLKILDVATGGGDLVVALSKRAKASDLNWKIDGCDISDRALEYAERFARQHSPLTNSFIQCDVLQDGVPIGYDVVMCSLFLHHLGRDEAVVFLRHMREACEKSLLINDLRRTRFGYLLARVGARLLTRSPIVHIDGPLSVRAAWSDDEVRQLAAEADINDPAITHCWPQRFLLSWRKP